jgi:hypothetical protein
MGALIVGLVRSSNPHHPPQQNFQIFVKWVYNNSMPKIKMGGKTIKLPYANKGGKMPRYGKGGGIPKMVLPKKMGK